MEASDDDDGLDTPRTEEASEEKQCAPTILPHIDLEASDDDEGGDTPRTEEASEEERLVATKEEREEGSAPTIDLEASDDDEFDSGATTVVTEQDLGN